MCYGESWQWLYFGDIWTWPLTLRAILVFADGVTLIWQPFVRGVELVTHHTQQNTASKSVFLIWELLSQPWPNIFLRGVHIGIQVFGRCYMHMKATKAATATHIHLFNNQSDFHWPAELCGIRPHNLEQSTSFAMSPRTVAEHLQAPAEDSAFLACVNHRLAPLWLNSEFGAAYKYPDSTLLNSPF